MDWDKYDRADVARGRAEKDLEQARREMSDTLAAVVASGVTTVERLGEQYTIMSRGGTYFLRRKPQKRVDQ